MISNYKEIILDSGRKGKSMEEGVKWLSKETYSREHGSMEIGMEKDI